MLPYLRQLRPSGHRSAHPRMVHSDVREPGRPHPAFGTGRRNNFTWSEQLRTLALTLLAVLMTACGATAAAKNPTPKPTPPRRFASPPKMTINPHRQYIATVRTTDGTFTLKLVPADAPIAVNNFIFLARRHFYDGLIFHRIVKGQYIQTGDPTGTGMGGPGYTITVEQPRRKYTVGTVAMARTNAPHSNGSQWFVITGHSGTFLPPSYTILGSLLSGEKVIKKIDATPVGVNPGSGELSDPIQDVKIVSLTIK
jgi:cyclophilin family peptidyl-prolyl cis-trans isomerase